MADIRINALATTATTPASDDYLALDGAAQGTRKILATNIANNVTDVILGSSGPSVKSTLSARAPRQGLVFDGTGGPSVSGIPAFGTGDFTVSAFIRKNSNIDVTLFGSDSTNAWLRLPTGGDVRWYSGGTLVLNLASSLTVGRTHLVTVTRSSGTTTAYLDGISLGSAADANNCSTAIAYIGSYSGTSTYANNGLIAQPLIYNRALSSSEVVALYEAGAPAGSDYNSASNTAINTSAWTNYLGTYTSFTGASATGFTAVKASGDAYASIVPTPVTAKGQKFRVTGTLTLNNGKTVVPGMYVDSGGATVSLTAGSFDITLTAGSAGSNLILVTTNGDADYTLANLSVTRLGLLLAPDVYQAGGGLSWYDTSGNSATITLPASGVTWNVPSSQKTASGWTYGGNLTVSGTGTIDSTLRVNGPTLLGDDAASIRAVTDGNVHFRNANVFSVYTGAGLDFLNDANSALTAATFRASAFNFLVGNATLAGNLTVSGTGTSSVAGKLQSIVPSATGYNQLYDTSGITTGRGAFAITSTGAGFAFGIESSVAGTSLAGSAAYSSYLGTSNATPFYLITNSVIGATLTSGGNLLLGTTTDSSNGKLQLATHTTSAGGIGFGTDTSLYRTGTGSLALDGGTLPILRFFNGASQYGYVYAGSADGELACVTGPLRLKSANTTALTLDSSQNATFAGTTTTFGGGSYAILSTAAGSGANLELHTVSAGTKIKIRPTAATVATFDGDTQATTLEGTIATQGGVASTPASASATGIAGTIKWDASYIYVCTATNTWKRAAIATW